MKFLDFVCLAVVAGTAEAWSPRQLFAESKEYAAESLPGCYCHAFVNGASLAAEALCQKHSDGDCRPPNSDGAQSWTCSDDSFLCDTHKKPGSGGTKTPEAHLDPHQCPEIHPQITLDTAATSGEWFVQQASTTAFFDAVVDKCFTQYYLFDLGVDKEDEKDREVLFQTYAEKKALPPPEFLELFKRWSYRYGDAAARRKLNVWGSVPKEEETDVKTRDSDAKVTNLWGDAPNGVQLEMEEEVKKVVVNKGYHSIPFGTFDSIGWLKKSLFADGSKADFWVKFHDLLSRGNGIGNFTIDENGVVVRVNPLSVFPTLMEQLDKGFVDVAICGSYKVASEFEGIAPCNAPKNSRLARPEDAKWFFVFAGSIDKATGHLAEGLVGDDLMYEYAIVTGGAQVPLENGKCAPGAGFINGGYQLLSRFPVGEQKAIELLRAFTEANTNIDVSTLKPVKQAGCTYKDSVFKGKDPFKPSVVKFGQSLASGDERFACPKVDVARKPITLKSLGLLQETLGGCFYIYFSTTFSGLDPNTDKCAQQGYFFRALRDGEDLGMTLTRRRMAAFSRRELPELEMQSDRPEPPVAVVELLNINNKIEGGPVVDMGDDFGQNRQTAFSLCGKDLGGEASEVKFKLGSCFPDQTPDAPPVGVLFSDWFILFVGFFVPGHVVDGGRFVPGYLSDEFALVSQMGPPGPFQPIVIATGGQPVDPTPDGCAAGTEFINSGLVVSSKDPDGISPEAQVAIFEFLKENHFDVSQLLPVKQGLKNGCASNDGEAVCYLSKANFIDGHI